MPSRKIAPRTRRGWNNWRVGNHHGCSIVELGVLMFFLKPKACTKSHIYIYIYIFFFVLSLASQTGLINVSKAASSSPAGGGGFAADFADGRGGGKPAAEPVGKMARDVRSIGTPPPQIYIYIYLRLIVPLTICTIHHNTYSKTVENSSETLGHLLRKLRLQFDKLHS